MKHLIFTLLLLLIVSCSSTPTSAKPTAAILSTENQDTYELYPTQNMWIFLKLNTADGRIWIVQYDVKGSNRLEVELDTHHRAKDEDAVAGRFKLYETKNMYNFILLDQKDGRVWQVQWSHDEENRMVLSI